LTTTIAKLRAQRGLTQEQVAAKLDISRAHYTNIENGKRMPSMCLAIRIAVFYACRMEELQFPSRSETIIAKYILESNNKVHQSLRRRDVNLFDGSEKRTKGVGVKMAIQDKLKELSALEGFAGVGVFTVNGESIAALGDDRAFNLQQIGPVANNVMINAQKACMEMGTGREDLVHISAEKAHLLLKCYNEGTDPVKVQPGKAHIHMVLILTSDASIGLAKIKIKSVIESLAPEVRA